MFLHCGNTKGWLLTEVVKLRAALIQIQAARRATGGDKRQHTLVILFSRQLLFSLVGVSSRDGRALH